MYISERKGPKSKQHILTLHGYFTILLFKLKPVELKGTLKTTLETRKVNDVSMSVWFIHYLVKNK